MSKLLYAFLAVLLLAVGGCYDPESDEHSDHSEPSDAPTEEDIPAEEEDTTEDSEPEEETITPPGVNTEFEEEFLESVMFDPHWEEQAVRDHRRVINVGVHVCESLDGGRTLHDVSEEIHQETQDYVSVDIMLEAAVYTFCPKYTDNFEAHIAAHKP